TSNYSAGAHRNAPHSDFVYSFCTGLKNTIELIIDNWKNEELNQANISVGKKQINKQRNGIGNTSIFQIRLRTKATDVEDDQGAVEFESQS
ncbi:hypothetical protein PFISCL1PPCAC_12229, partial [Pristionchus fissidentatus]